MTREQLLLKVAYQFLKKQENSGYVLNLLTETVVWDGVECDGNCLMEEIQWLLQGKGFDPDEQEEIE